MKLGSLFDGSGGFPLAGALHGVEPVWASEIEPYPIAVTKSRFPGMKHLGSVTDINGAEIEPVDIITFGSPCQDMSIAGKRAGMKHTENGDDETTRSGLFYEAVRIIKEMRDATNGLYPTFAVWENVPGAYSGNGGADFRCVLSELAKAAGWEGDVPQPEIRWAYAGEICADGWSLAWRTLDAQYWGVPQRRRRIYLVTDFRGQRAGKILFEREGLPRNPAQSGEARQGASEDAEGCLGRSGGFIGRQGAKSGSIGFEMERSPTLRGSITVDAVSERYVLQGNGIDRADSAGCNGKGWREDKCYTLNTLDRPAVVSGVYSIENHPADSRVSIDEAGKVQTLTSRMGTGGGNVPMVMTPYTLKIRSGCEGGQRGFDSDR